MSKFETALRESAEIAEHILEEDFARDFYAALCNAEFVNIFTLEKESMTWRAASALVVELRGLAEDEEEFYCSGHEGECIRSMEFLFLQLGWERNERLLQSDTTYRRRREGDIFRSS